MHNQNRRHFIRATIGMLLLMPLAAACNKTNLRGNEPIYINLEGVKDIQGLIFATKKVCGNLLPTNVPAEEFYKAAADTFVMHAREAFEMGLKVPNWVIDKLPKKVVSDANKAKPEYIALTLLGLTLMFPIFAFFAIIFSSILVMTKYITDKLNETSI